MFSLWYLLTEVGLQQVKDYIFKKNTLVWWLYRAMLPILFERGHLFLFWVAASTIMWLCDYSLLHFYLFNAISTNRKIHCVRDYIMHVSNPIFAIASILYDDGVSMFVPYAWPQMYTRLCVSLWSFSRQGAGCCCHHHADQRGYVMCPYLEAIKEALHAIKHACPLWL